MTGPIKASTGSVAAPSYTFASETASGIYRKSAGIMGFVIGGSEIAEVAATGINVSTGLNLSVGGNNVATLPISYANIQNVAASRLLGNPTGAPASVSEISLGAGLSFSGTSLVGTTSAALFPGFLSGLILSTAGGSGTFGIAAGAATDTTNAAIMALASAYTKTTASWVVGSGNGALDTGAIANTTWYHVFLIERVDTGVTDILFSLSATSPTMPANYTLFRRIGTMKTDGSAHWVLFQQIGDEFLLDTPVTDINGTITATASTQTLASVPTGIVVNALINIGIQQANAGVFVYLSALSVADIAPTSAAVTIRTLIASVANYQGRFQIRTNTSAQFRARSDSGSTTLICNTMGWIDTRGK